MARILEIRAKDAQNVYVRVYWLYRPDELLNGRQWYHGTAEYIATNHMEIVDALRFIRHIPIIHVNNEVSWLQQAQLACYWRQTYDYMLQKLSVGPLCCRSSHPLMWSNLGTQDPVMHCICSTPVNLDEQPIHCNGDRCGLLLHRHCITRCAHSDWVARFQEDGNMVDGSYGGKSRNQTGSERTWKVEMTVSERPGYEGQLRLLWTDFQNEKRRELDIKCLGCGQKIV